LSRVEGGGLAEAVFLGVVGVLYILEVVGVAMLLILPPTDLVSDIVIYMAAMAALTSIAVHLAASRAASCTEGLRRRGPVYTGREAAENAWLHGFWRTVTRAAEELRSVKTPAMLLAAGSLGLAYPAALAMIHRAYNTLSQLMGREAVQPTPGAIVASFSLLYPLAYMRYRRLA